VRASIKTASLKTFATVGLGVRAVVTAAMAAGCIAAPGFAHAAAANDRDHGGQDQSARKLEKQVVAAEHAAIKAPRDAAARARLAQTYLAAGRFVSAGSTFEDSVALGDKSASTALGMALSYIASGRNAEALSLLGQWGDALPASDHGLALALAGDPAQAITILSSAIRQGENTPKIRQNLAYAYAMGGRLAEARVVASQDVPADKLDARVSEWALQASVGSSQSRVAALLGAPVLTDAGRPAQLALVAAMPSPALAVSDAPAAPAAEELPALSGPPPALASSEPQAGPQAEFVPAHAAPAPTGPAMAEASPAARQYVANPVVQDIAARIAARQAVDEVPAPARTPSRKDNPPAARREHMPVGAKLASAPVSGTHLVQLGSFSTEAGARRAWGIFVGRDRSLKGRELHITEATVNGRRYFRVAAAGYEAAEARIKCSTLKGRGGDCLALAADRRPTGVPVRAVAERIASR
jgi:Flp pilus assembly protein TadD